MALRLANGQCRHLGNVLARRYRLRPSLTGVMRTMASALVVTVFSVVMTGIEPVSEPPRQTTETVVTKTASRAVRYPATALAGAWAPGITNIYVVNKASRAWPVLRAENEWNGYLKANRIRLNFVSAHSCVQLSPCFTITEQSGGLNKEREHGMGGMAFLLVGSSLRCTGIVLFNGNGDIHLASYGARKAVAFHELGHALGLGHDVVRNDPLYPGVGDNTLKVPSKRNLNALVNAYR